MGMQMSVRPIAEAQIRIRSSDRTFATEHEGAPHHDDWPGLIRRNISPMKTFLKTLVLRPPLRAYAATVLTLLAPVQAQQVPSSTTTASEGAILLSPFTVATERDTGYAATEILAGTRLRTNLRDIASSMSVLTPELLRDLGATSIDEAIASMSSSDKLVGESNSTGNGVTAEGAVGPNPTPGEEIHPLSPVAVSTTSDRGYLSTSSATASRVGAEIKGMISYTWRGKARAQLNVSNLADKLYYPGGNANRFQVDTPRTVTVSASSKFYAVSAWRSRAGTLAVRHHRA